MAHILPHWTWPERTNQITPVHVFTSGDEAELFLNDQSLGRKKKGANEYRLRWDDVTYQSGTLKVVAYKGGKKWATDEMKTAGEPAKLKVEVDRKEISDDGRDLCFVTVTVTDGNGVEAARATNRIRFKVEGAGKIIATDNGDATSFESFASHERKAFSGRCLVIVGGLPGQSGAIKVIAESDGLVASSATIKAVAASAK
jgi:beta-galactosidase